MACLGTFADCDHDPSNGCEADTATDPAHCGACEVACSISNGTPACVASACAVASCAAPFADCDGEVSNGCETDTSSDASHCGGCGKRCAAVNGAASCAGGACVLACDAGFGDCDGDPSNGCEAPLDTAQDCGACGNACPAGRACANGACASGWLGMSATGAPAPRRMAAAAWIGSGVFVWGGNDGSAPLDDGAIYDDHADAWKAIGSAGAPSARILAGAAWTGAHVAVWGGGDALGDAGLSTGARYAPGDDAWTPMSNEGAPAARQAPILVWTGRYVLVWGGTSGGVPVAGGARYDDAADAWLPITSAGAPSPRLGAAWAWTGKDLILFGGTDGSTAFYADGYAYDPEADQWRQLSPTGAPSPRADAFAAWTGAKLLVWDGRFMMGSLDNSGVAYDPAADAWTSMMTSGNPSKRSAPATRTGWSAWSPLARQALVIGGIDGMTPKLDGGAYAPATAAWASVASWPSAVAHEWGVAVWTGQEMVLWSGTKADGMTISSAGDRYMP